jgi:hypothetical protein
MFFLRKVNRRSALFANIAKGNISPIQSKVIIYVFSDVGFAVAKPFFVGIVAAARVFVCS